MKETYTLGIDFGTLSVRALLVSINDGHEVYCAESTYEHGIIENGQKVLQDPNDYISSLKSVVNEVTQSAMVDRQSIKGIGIDFTSSTILPCKNDGTPILNIGYSKYADAYVKLWKQHSAWRYAQKIDAATGQKTSSESFFAKVLETYCECRSVYDEAELFIEAGDWIVLWLTGNITRSTCMLSYKAMWSAQKGYLTAETLENIESGFSSILNEGKLKGMILTPGMSAGKLRPEIADILGLSEDTQVSCAIIDAHAAMPAASIYDESKMLHIFGTSSCQIVVSKDFKNVNGMMGIIKDGIFPDYWGYEAGQAAAGDSFAWFIDKCVPYEYKEAADKAGISIHKYLRDRVSYKKPGETGLIVLDWQNGNRSVLNNSNLKGVICGLTLSTAPEDIYRAYIEGTAFGMRKITDAFSYAGMDIKDIYSTGGIPKKDSMTMQIYADVMNKPFHIINTLNGPALGSAIYAASACGAYSSVFEASEIMKSSADKVYYPIMENVKLYEEIYIKYTKLHDYFGKGDGKDVF